MTSDKTDPTVADDTISRVNNRVVPARSVKRARSASVELRLGMARRSFASLVAAAENPPLTLRAAFEIDGLGTLRTGVLRDFHLAEENEAGRIGFSVSWRQCGREPLKHVTGSDTLHQALRKALYAHGLKFRSASSATAHKIEVEPEVPAWISVSGEPGGRRIAIELHNVGMLGSTTYQVPADTLDRRLVDTLVALVSSGDHAFYDRVSRLSQRRG